MVEKMHLMTNDENRLSGEYFDFLYFLIAAVFTINRAVTCFGSTVTCVGVVFLHLHYIFIKHVDAQCVS